MFLSHFHFFFCCCSVSPVRLHGFAWLVYDRRQYQAHGKQAKAANARHNTHVRYVMHIAWASMSPMVLVKCEKKRKKYENQANVVRCTHEHITFGARTSARCEWVFRCGSFFGKCRGNANGTTLTIQRTVYAVCETLMFFYFLFLCVVFFFCADLERELDSRPRMPRHNRHNLARANETHALHEYMYIGEAGGAVVYLV